MARRYLNERGKIKSHGHAKANALSSVILTGQFVGNKKEVSDFRKSFLLSYRTSGSNLLEFFWSRGFDLSEIHELWTSCFNGNMRDDKSIKLDDVLIESYKLFHSRKNKKLIANIVDVDVDVDVDLDSYILNTTQFESY